MTSNRDALVVVGVLVGLVGATVLPFALPAFRSAEEPFSAVSGDKSAPAGVRQPDGTVSAQSFDRHGRVPLPRPPVDCNTSPSQRPPQSFPLTVDGNPITGRGVSVGIVDPSGFDVDDPRIASDVEATRSFRTRGTADIANDGDSDHGTETAAFVSRLAPDARLYLANFQKAVDFIEAIEWAIERDVDVIVAPATFYAKPNDGSAPVSRAVTRATERGIPVVVPTGNVAHRHWEGSYDDGPWLEFGANDTRLYLRGSDRPVRAWLWWNETAASGPNEFRIVLYEERDGHTRRVATSTDYPKGPVGANQVLFERIRSNNLLTSSIGNGSYYLRVEGPEGATHRVELVTAAHPIETPVRWGSLMAPATANGSVVAVGAAAETGRRLRRSSIGPTNDGRPGIDLLAPGVVTGASGTTIRGTSAATAYTGGVVALLAAVDPSLTADRAEAILQSTAVRRSPDAANVTTGYGLIDPSAALACIADDQRASGR